MHVIELGGHAGFRRWALVFEIDDEVMEGLEAFARENDVTAAHLTALGAFRRATLAFFEWDSKEYQEIPVDEQVEVAALVGNVGRGDDGVAVHVHCVLGRRDGSAVAGHLLRGTVRPTLEVLVEEGAGTLRRRRSDDETRLTLIRP